MFEPLVALEEALDAVLPRPRLSGQLPQALVSRAHEWSEAVWRAAKARGAFSIDAAAIAHGLEIGRRPVFATGVFGMRRALSDLAESYRIADAQREMHDRRYLPVRFEEVVTRPAHSIGRLAAFLDVPDLPVLHRPTAAGARAASNSSFAVADDGTIDPSRAAADAAMLSNDDRLWLAVIVGDAAGAIGDAVPA